MKLKLYLIHSNNREDTVYMKGDIFFKNSHNIKIALLVDIHRGFFLFSLSNAEQILSSDTFSLSGENRGDIFFYREIEWIRYSF
jgi:hypothetical protein